MHTSPKPITKPAIDQWLEQWPTPEQEVERIRELRSYQVLDTLPEPQFDAITELASDICETEIALVSLIDTDRQWFKSKVGLKVNETSRNISICQYTIMGDDILEVNDTWESDLLRNNPLVTGDPRIRFYAGAPLKTKNGNKIGTLCVIDSKPKKLNSKQKKNLVALADQVVAQLELRQLAGREKELNEQKTRFVSLVSHQFRTPLTVILTNAELLKLICDESKNTESSQLEKHIGIVTDQARKMVRLMNDVLTFSRESPTRLARNPQIIDLMPLCDVLCEELNQIQSDGRKIEIKKSGNPKKVFADPQQISSALTNFLTNAFKYSSDRNPVLELSYEKGKVMILIRDEGVGIPEKDQPHLFRPFFRAHNVEDIPGTGLGLVIAKEYVEMNNGRLRVSSKQGKGTTVSILLPTMESREK